MDGGIEGAVAGKLLFLGLQGSYGRGEATAESDIDVVAVFDEVGFGELKVYRSVLDGMEKSAPVCGFVAGVGELCARKKYDLLQLYLDTVPRQGLVLQGGIWYSVEKPARRAEKGEKS